MLLYQEIKSALNSARVLSRSENHRERAGVLYVVVGEIERLDADERTDTKVISILRKMISNAELMKESFYKRHQDGNLGDDAEAVRKLDLEISIYNELMPPQLSDLEIRGILEANGFDITKDMKGAQAYMKDTYEGRYTGGQVAKIMQEFMKK